MRLIGGNISDTPVKEVGDGSAFNAGGGGSTGWNGVPWDYQTDLGFTTYTYGYHTTGVGAWGTLTNGGVIAALTGEGNGADGVTYINLPNAGAILIGRHRGSYVYDFAADMGHLWWPPGTTIDNSSYGNNIVVIRVDGSFEDCCKVLPGLVNMGDYDEATNLKGFTGPTQPAPAANPNGCTVFYTGWSAFATDQSPAMWRFGIKNSSGAYVTNGGVHTSTPTIHNSGGLGEVTRKPFPFKLHPGESLSQYSGWNASHTFLIAYDPLGWV